MYSGEQEIQKSEAKSLCNGGKRCRATSLMMHTQINELPASVVNKRPYWTEARGDA